MVTRPPTIESIGKPVAAVVDAFLKSRISAITNTRDFPGMQPVSLDRTNVSALLTSDYHVCEKSDGIRVLGLMIQKNATGLPPTHSLFITDRKYEFREIENLAFPTSVSGNEFHNETIVDGELVFDKVATEAKSGENVLSLYLFDLLAINGQSVMGLNLLQRFDRLWKGVTRPFDAYYSGRKETLPFRVLLKENFKAYHIAHVLNKVIPDLPHGNDGLVFTPVNTPYTKGTCKELFKWKPDNLNTVDFAAIPAENDPSGRVWEIWVADRGVNRYYGLFYLDFEKSAHEDTRSLAPHSIVELFWDFEWKTPVFDETRGCFIDTDGGWRFLRLRTDKLTPNDIKVVSKINSAMKNKCSKEEVFELVTSRLAACHVRLDKKLVGGTPPLVLRRHPNLTIRLPAVVSGS